MKYLEWNEPIYSGDGPTINSIVRMKLDDVPHYWRCTHPEHDYTDEDCIYEFTVVHWAWEKDYPE